MQTLIGRSRPLPDKISARQEEFARPAGAQGPQAPFVLPLRSPAPTVASSTRCVPRETSPPATRHAACGVAASLPCTFRTFKPL
ncbi:hypothetical protein GCM10022206_23720 [Streptomyces chiangmaiensis]